MRQIRIAGETTLNPKLVKLPIIKGSKCPRQSTKSPDQPELCAYSVDNGPEPRLLGKGEPILGFTLRIFEPIACREKVSCKVIATEGHASEVAHLICCLQRTAQQITPS